MKRLLILVTMMCLALMCLVMSALTEGTGYTVEFQHDGLEYVLPGGASVAMSEILSALGLSGEVTAVEISDTSLFSASNESGAWIVTAHQAFDTTEWMKVTINDVTYEITVTDTQATPTTISGTDYTLFTGFTATDGTNASAAAYNYPNLVDGNLDGSSSWHLNNDTQPYYIEFNADNPIIPKGYIFNTYSADNFKPTSWVLRAKANIGDDWTELDNLSGQSISEQEYSHSCNNEGNNAYKYFRFEVSNTSNNIWLTEIRLYGSSPDVYYTRLTKKDATCTETGIKQDCYLRNDGKYFTDETGATELTESDVIDPIKPHTGEHHEATDVNIEYWQCSMCSKYFSNVDCTTEITEEETKIYRTITIDGSISELVTSNVNQALAGAIVTLTVSHLLDASTLKVNNGAVELTDIGSNQYTLTVPAADVTVTAETLSTYSFSLPDNMEIVSTSNEADGNGKYISGTVITFAPSLRYSASNVSDGTNTLEPDANGVYTVTIENANINITATVVGSSTLYLPLATSDFTAADGETLVGSTSRTLTIANGAGITLSGATISGGIVCEGSATITLVGTNSVNVNNVSASSVYKTAGIQIGGSGTMLTIRGDGSLTATGGSAAAGMGLGRTWDENVTAGAIVIEGGTVNASGDIGIGIGTVGNSQTASIDGISIKGGTVNASLGKGTINYGSEVTIGYIKIYDTIDMVDASKITETVTYMHVDGETESDVTDNKTDYFTIGENGDRRIIVPKDDTDYTITIADGIEHGTITGATTAKYMETVTINATPDFGYHFVRLVVKDADNNDVASTNNTFQMPKGGATVNAEFALGSHGTTEFAWGYYGPDGFVNEATIYDGVTTVNLQQKGQSYNILKYEEYTYSKFRLDNNTYDADIPYAGGTGEFYETGNGTSFRILDNGQTGYYDVTLTDVGNGKWGVSILPTPAQMDVVPDQTYTGSAITPEPLVIAGSLSLTKDEDYVYSYTNNTNVGTATVRATFQGDYASLGYVEKTFTIGKGTPTVTAPTPIENLVYNGFAQTLVTAGSTDFGTLLYSLEENGTYSADIPTATAIGDYTVYYKVEASDNWEAVDAASVAVTITARTYTVTFDANGGEGTMEPMLLTYNGDWTALTANTFTRTGYGFKGWNTEADGTGTDYDDEEQVRNLTTETSIVLYAQWGEDIASCTATVPDQTMGTYSYIFYKFEAANSDATLATEMGVVVKDGDDVLTFGTDYEFGSVTFADGSDGMPGNVGDECLLEIKGKGNYAGSLWAPFTITVADDGGTWGTLTWSFHAGTLTVSGTGAMDATSDYSGYPWFGVASYVTVITIGEGVTTIADAAFSGTSQVNHYSRMATVTLPTTLTTIGGEAFAYMTALETIDLTHVTAIGGSAFNQCVNLTAIVPATVTSMGACAFRGCKSVTYAVIIGSMENGTVTASPTSAANDATITLTVIPDDGYTLDTLTVIALDGQIVTVNGSQFTMPAVNVNVRATFKEIPKFTVTFAAGEGATGTMDLVTVDSGAEYTLPACGFTAPEGKSFSSWSVKVGDADTVTMAVGETITVTADTTVTAVWEDIGPKIAQNTLELSAVLNLKYYLSVPQGFDGSGASMAFSLNSQTVSFSSAEKSGDYYVFPCRVYAYQMAETITATFTWQENGETKTLTDTYSVKQYLDALAADANTDAKTLALVKAVQNYGHYLQPYLARINGLTYTEMPKATGTDVNVSAAATGSAEQANAIEHSTTLDDTRITNLQIRLNINSGTDLMFEFKLADGVSGTVTAKAGDGEFATVTPNGSGVYRVSKQTIAANNLEYPYAFVVNVGDATVITTTASVMDYIKIVLNNSTAEDEKTALAALYEYWAAANTY